MRNMDFAGKTLALSSYRRAYALQGGAEVVGGYRQAPQLVRRDPLLEIAQVDRAPHARERRFAAQGFEVCS
jgi:hypothetical protein